MATATATATDGDWHALLITLLVNRLETFHLLSPSPSQFPESVLVILIPNLILILVVLIASLIVILIVVPQSQPYSLSSFSSSSSNHSHHQSSLYSSIVILDHHPRSMSTSCSFSSLSSFNVIPSLIPTFLESSKPKD